MTRALVTGAGGFIGSHLCERLLRDGWSVRAFVRYTSHDQYGALMHLAPDVRDGLDVVAGDLRDADAVRRNTSGCEVVFHLGAVISIPHSYRSPREVVENNVLGTLNVLEAARDGAVTRVVHTSTSEVYGTARTDRIEETHVLAGQSPYAASKIGADKLAEAFALSFATPVVTLRPFNTYGPRQSPRAVIPTILGQALAGDSVRLGSLAPTRDFTYVTDTVDAFVRAATAGGLEGEVIHLGSGKEISVGDLVVVVGQLLGRSLTVIEEHGRRRPAASEIARLCSNPSRAAELLGWHPEVGLREGLRRTAEWLQASPGWFQLPPYAR